MSCFGSKNYNSPNLLLQVIPNLVSRRRVSALAAVAKSSFKTRRQRHRLQRHLARVLLTPIPRIFFRTATLIQDRDQDRGLHPAKKWPWKSPIRGPRGAQARRRAPPTTGRTSAAADLRTARATIPGSIPLKSRVKFHYSAILLFFEFRLVCLHFSAETESPKTENFPCCFLC